jgi:hypothetical protein
MLCATCETQIAALQLSTNAMNKANINLRPAVKLCRWSSKHEADAPKACCTPQNPRGGREEASYDPCQPQIKIPRKVRCGLAYEASGFFG